MDNTITIVHAHADNCIQTLAFISREVAQQYVVNVALHHVDRILEFEPEDTDNYCSLRVTREFLTELEDGLHRFESALQFFRENDDQQFILVDLYLHDETTVQLVKGDA